MAKTKAKKASDSDSETEAEYVVERICQKRTRNGKTEYFLKWKGWPE